MRVFLTGGTGLLGSHLAAELRASGHEIVAMHRRGADTLFLEEQGCALAEGDVRDEPELIAERMRGCTHVAHTAGVVYAGGEWPKVRAVNVDGTRNVLTAARLVDATHTVHVSSVAVYGPVDGPVDERTPIDTDLIPGDLYARSKREAEEVAHGIAEKRGLSVTVVRPAAVYGERDRLLTPAVARFLRLPVSPVFGPGTNTLPVVYAGNVAVAIKLALEAGRGGSTYDIGLDHPLSQRGLFELMAEGMERKVRFLHLPAPLVRAAGELLARLGVRTPGAEHLPLQRLTRLVLGANPYPSHAIRDELGWNPPHHHAQALLRTGRWIANHASR